jgi:hypothetical protein
MGWVASKTYNVTSHIIYNSLQQKVLFATKDDLIKGRPLITIFGRVVRWLRGRPVRAGNRYDPGDTLPAERLAISSAEAQLGQVHMQQIQSSFSISLLLTNRVTISKGRTVCGYSMVQREGRRRQTRDISRRHQPLLQ